MCNGCRCLPDLNLNLVLTIIDQRIYSILLTLKNYVSFLILHKHRHNTRQSRIFKSGCALLKAMCSTLILMKVTRDQPKSHSYDLAIHPLRQCLKRYPLQKIPHKDLAFRIIKIIYSVLTSTRAQNNHHRDGMKNNFINIKLCSSLRHIKNFVLSIEHISWDFQSERLDIHCM